LTDVNGMHVTVDEHAPPVPTPTGDGTIYTLKSTAYLAGETKAETVAQVLVTGGTIEEGGEGGELAHNPDMKALSVIDEYTIIFTTQQKSEFWGREEENLGPGTGTPIEPCDLGALNMATGTGHLFLDGDEVGLGTQYKINGVHYYQEGGSDYLLMSVRDNDKVGTQTFSKSDIIRLEVVVNEDDPDNPYISAVNSITLFDTIIADDTNVDIVALSRRDDGTILFSFSNESATLGGNPFDRAEVIEFDGNTYTRLFNADDILPDNPNLVLDCLAILSESDPRLLLSFDVDPVTGSDGGPIKSEDIAVWDPGDPDDDTINLHISMSIVTWAPGAERTVSIISWEVSP